MTTIEQRDAMLEKLRFVPDLFCRAMMGEFLLYSAGQLFGGIYNDRLLLKRTAAGEKFGLPEEIPYQGAKPMYRIVELDDPVVVQTIIRETCALLPPKK